MSSFQLPDNQNFWTFACVIILLIASLLPRFYALGEISFQRDEEYTAFAALAVADGENAKLPSGMSYRRALPLTYLSAGSALLFCTENELSYRLPATLVGALSPIILFLHRLYKGDEVIAFLYAFRYMETMYYYQSGFNHQLVKKYSPWSCIDNEVNTICHE